MVQDNRKMMEKMEPYNISLINNIKDKLIEKKQTVAVAESVTSGHLQAGFSLAQEAMKFFQGGITTYNLGQKARHFHVDPIHAINCNCVSQRIAYNMARGAGRIFSSDWGIGVTGYATPDPLHQVDTPFAFYSFSFKNKEIKTERIDVEKSQQLTAQVFYVNTIYQIFLELLSQDQ